MAAYKDYEGASTQDLVRALENGPVSEQVDALAYVLSTCKAIAPFVDSLSKMVAHDHPDINCMLLRYWDRLYNAGVAIYAATMIRAMVTSDSAFRAMAAMRLGNSAFVWTCSDSDYAYLKSNMPVQYCTQACAVLSCIASSDAVTTPDCEDVSTLTGIDLILRLVIAARAGPTQQAQICFRRIWYAIPIAERCSAFACARYFGDAGDACIRTVCADLVTGGYSHIEMCWVLSHVAARGLHDAVAADALTQLIDMHDDMPSVAYEALDCVVTVRRPTSDLVESVIRSVSSSEMSFRANEAVEYLLGLAVIDDLIITLTGRELRDLALAFYIVKRQ